MHDEVVQKFKVAHPQMFQPNFIFLKTARTTDSLTANEMILMMCLRVQEITDKFLSTVKDTKKTRKMSI